MTPTTTATETHPSTHATFTIERHFAAPVDRVFHAFANMEAKDRWFRGTAGSWKSDVREMDFRVGGHERLRGVWKDGTVTDFLATYHDIVPGERIVYAYDMYKNDRKLSVSLATIQLAPDGTGTRMVLTEQGVFLDGLDGSSSREHGTNVLMDAVARSLEAD